MNPSKETWVLYDHPTDFPDQCVARKHIDGKPTLDYIGASTLGLVRRRLIQMNLNMVPRKDDDEPHIVETWE